MFKFIHAADIHLDSSLSKLEKYEGAPVDTIRSAARRAFENLVDLAIREKVAFLLIAGDLYDGNWKDYNSGLFLVTQITRLHQAGISTYIISGNHDAENKISFNLPLQKNPDGTAVMLSHSQAETVRMEKYSVALHGRGFQDAVVSENVALDYPAAVAGWFNIGMLHTSLEGASGDHARYAPCTVSDLQSRGYQYWALGHIHTRRNWHRDGDPPVVFPGNIQGRHIRETGAKGCQLVSVDDQQQVTMQFVPLDVFRWHALEIDLTDAADGEEVESRTQDALRELAAEHDLPLGVRITLQGDCPAHREMASDPLAWTNRIRSLGVTVDASRIWVERVRIKTSSPVLRDAIPSDGPIADLVAYIAELRTDETALKELGSCFSDLQAKLPADITSGDDGLDFRQPTALRDLLDQIEPLLLDRLTQKEAS
ncbi:metallophosphoesterase family protein [Lignipirellula cremea]|uniref:Putative metallophosphoesterase YhaO n=1 Tax=Lignipirellula cremea TaxID=2528010 RepID=A0A518DU51_9BACT|nr:DNA repair exonuclease [Lignipirellula cremea]QDU95359.1 putative metallophosphoesterase YhaO [Lignipirellula cremea]